MNGRLIAECLEGFPYIPATHRNPSGTLTRLLPIPDIHRMRVELNTKKPDQEACVILAYPNRHLCPWTEQELPWRAELPEWQDPANP